MKGSNLNPATYQKLKANSIEQDGLHHVDLENSHIGSEELLLVAEAINSNIRSIDTACPVESINLCGNHVCRIKGVFHADQENKHTTLDTEGFDSLVKVIIKMGVGGSRLRRLNLSDNHFGKKGLKLVSSMLENGPPSLTELVIKNCVGPNDSIEALLPGLEATKYLQTLDLQGNYVDADKHQFFATAFENTRIKYLNVRDCQLGPEGSVLFLKAVSKSIALETLYLGDNNIGNPGAKAAASLMMVNKVMRYLDLEENGIGDEGAGYLSEGLSKNKVLAFLDLRWNPGVTNEGAAKLGKALTINLSALKKMFLLGTAIDTEGVALILKSSVENDVIEIELDLLP